MDSRDPAVWRLAFLLVASVLETSWTKFLRIVILLLLLVGAIALLGYLLGPYAVGALGIISIGGAALTRRAHGKAAATAVRSAKSRRTACTESEDRADDGSDCGQVSAS